MAGKSKKKKASGDDGRHSTREVKRYLGVLSEEFQGGLKAIAEQYVDLKSDNVELKQDVSELKEDVSELKSNVSELKSNVSGLKSDVSELKNEVSDLHSITGSHTEAIGKLLEDTEIVKTNVEFLKGAMHKTVPYDEFNSLERRVSLLEKKR